MILPSHHAFTRSRTLGLIALIIALTSLSACNQDRAIAVRRMNEGLTDNSIGRVSDATKKLEEASETDPTYADPPYFLGQIQHQKSNNLDAATQSFKTALKRDPENPQIQYKLGTVLAEKKQYGEAIEHFKKATAKEPTFAKAWYRLGASQLALKEYAPGVESLMKSIKEDPTMSFSESDPGGVAFHNLGDLYITFRFFDKALSVYEEGIKFNPKAAVLYHGQGVALLKLERFSAAADAFKKALELDQAMTSAFFNLAVAQHAAGQTKDALKTLEVFMNRADQSRDAARLAAASALSSELEASLQK